MQFQKAADEITNVLFALTKGFHLFCLLKHEPFKGLDGSSKTHSLSQGKEKLMPNVNLTWRILC